ncbi:hypothetical protein TRFO_36106 [Tritrichomonas foetus]|uniref:HMG box domain-containing protein n=1 Tax=Tritrichomonas foetus TaxID=1144522 RepID=A0A1J4JEU6_9EUKA|nr:hypothetical protein TRFO_36106 [Tritrichomonas foetus]|eukprot:OHS97674.1 hypothetical protein TRFO_36106 [Tritrichomonas foetus]
MFLLKLADLIFGHSKEKNNTKNDSLSQSSSNGSFQKTIDNIGESSVSSVFNNIASSFSSEKNTQNSTNSANNDPSCNYHQPHGLNPDSAQTENSYFKNGQSCNLSNEKMFGFAQLSFMKNCVSYEGVWSISVRDYGVFLLFKTPDRFVALNEKLSKDMNFIIYPTKATFVIYNANSHDVEYCTLNFSSVSDRSEFLSAISQFCPVNIVNSEEHNQPHIFNNHQTNFNYNNSQAKNEYISKTNYSARNNFQNHNASKVINNNDQKKQRKKENKEQREQNRERLIFNNPAFSATINKKGVPTKYKKARTAYNFFVSEKRLQVIERYPDINQTDLMKEIALLWKACSPEDKKKYKIMAEEDHARAEAEKKLFLHPPKTQKKKAPIVSHEHKQKHGHEQKHKHHSNSKGRSHFYDFLRQNIFTPKHAPVHEESEYEYVYYSDYYEEDDDYDEEEIDILISSDSDPCQRHAAVRSNFNNNRNKYSKHNDTIDLNDRSSRIKFL